MTELFNADASIAVPPMVAHARDCRCTLHARRRLGGALLGAGVLATAAPAVLAQDLSAECQRSGFTKVVSAEQIEKAAGQQYRSMLNQAGSQRALGPVDHPQVRRLRYIADRIVPFTTTCNPRAADWKWEVNLIGSQDLNAFCMPGGKIAFYYGILAKLQLSDDEVAMIMGHEVAHALLEHARERMGKTMATRGAIEIGAALFGLGNAGRMMADMGGQLLTLRFSRDDESEADALGLMMASQAGYNPRAGVTLWQKMMSASKGAPPQWLSTHPSGEARIAEIEARMPRVEPVYRQAAKPGERFGPPAPASAQPKK
ncbi:M48 family metallopeptidase [Aquincola sp. S2]|uniref:M48 family metallopeptidase n=1 Tax=Pseudaquabacterium terrae TaxID=2732868 RepID=A0ABX2EKR8_9BURK|nr:M48 family metallopeptidase [Aquabacterium terrae]NRF69246.1 M48 family metallopeptidase [Aquabacterium terrae]